MPHLPGQTETASRPYLRALAQLVRSCAVGETEVAREAGLPPDVLNESARRVPADAAQRLWVVLERRSGDPAFGLHVAEQVGLGGFELLEFLTASCTTLGEAFSTFIRYQPALVGAAGFALQAERRLVHFSQVGTDVPSIAELSLAAALLHARRICGQPLAPRAVSFVHQAPPSTAEHTRFFGTEPDFGQPVAQLVFDRSACDLPLVGAEPRLREILAEYARERMTTAATAPPFVAEAKDALRAAMAAGNTKLEAVADRLGVSARTLQRRLAQHGESHQRLLDALRLEVFAHLAGERGFNRRAVAEAVGYGSSASLERALPRLQANVTAHAERRPAPRRLRKL